ncbi:MAG TPA: hypothetical protein VEY95_05730 [Azospirillaceae bacterium]|nr:hypothetical protein [Azospirillaceae bacterium]
MVSLIISIVAAVIIIVAGGVVADMVAKLAGESPRTRALIERIDIMSRLQAALETRRQGLEAGLIKARGQLERSREANVRMRRRLETVLRSSDFALRTVVGYAKPGDEAFMVKVVNRTVRAGEKDPNILLNESWVNAQVVILRAGSMEEARQAVGAAFPAAQGFMVAAVQAAPDHLASLVPPVSTGYARQAS